MCYSKIVRLLQYHGAILPPSEDKDMSSQFRRLTSRRIRGRARKNRDAANIVKERKRSMSIQSDNLHGTVPHPPGQPGQTPTMGTTGGKPPGVTTTKVITTPASLESISTSDGRTDEFTLWNDIASNIQKTLPSSHSLPLQDAACIGITQDIIAVLNTNINPVRLAGCRDRRGNTALMKAAYRGHLPIVKELLSRKVPVDATDNEGLTALVWACFGGDLRIVRALIEIGRAKPEGAEHASIQPWRESFIPTPLMAACFAGHTKIVKYLVSSAGACPNRRVGAPKGRSPLMISAWLRHHDIVKFLVDVGAEVDPDVDEWLRSGMLRLKRMSVEHSSWAYEISTHHKEGSLGRGVGAGGAKKGSMREELWLISPEDFEAIGSISEVLTKGRVSLTDRVTGEKRSLQLNAADLEDINSTEASDALSIQKPRFNQGLHLDSLMETNPEMVIDLTDQFPSRGTELDHLCVQVFKCVLQLVLAANSNVKHHYVVIAAKAINYSQEIIAAIDIMDKNVGSTQSAMSPVSPQYSASSSNKLGEGSLFASCEVRKRIKARAKVLNTDYNEELTFATKIACGIWPPANAVADMIRSAAALAKACRELVDLANIFGYYPIIDKPLELKFEPYQDSTTASVAETEDQLDDEDDKDVLVRPSIQSYDNYRRQNDLKTIQKLSKTYDGKTGIPTSSTLPRDLSSMAQQDYNNPNQLSQQIPEIDADAEFFKTLEEHLKRFVLSVTELKRIKDQQLKEQYVVATAMVHAKVDVILEEIRTFDLFAEDLSDGGSGGAGAGFEALTLEKSEAEAIEATGIRLHITEFPALLMPLLKEATAEVKSAALRITEAGRLASGFSPPPNAEKDMLESCYPCVLSVKKLFSLTKEVANKVRKVLSEDRNKKEEWNRKRLQNDKVKALFQVWQGQDDEVENQGNELSVSDIAKLRLEDGVEGLIVDTQSQQVKGGRLMKLIDFLTARKNIDEEFLFDFLLTHHSFVTSVELLAGLIRRYERFRPPPDLTERLFKAWLDLKVKVIQKNVIDTFKYWLNTHFEEDFGMNELLMGNLRGYIERVIIQDWEAQAKELLHTLDSK
ncbi:hypothetical protein HDU76_007215, partial [Blyttiomyces sp. JEL0837]